MTLKYSKYLSCQDFRHPHCPDIPFLLLLYNLSFPLFFGLDAVFGTGTEDEDEDEDEDDVCLLK